jgi:predicted O-methyltransferase YrrM
MSPKQLGKIDTLAIRTHGVYGAAVEIGAHQGLSATHIAAAIEPDTLHVVDHWRGNDDMTSEIRARDNYSIFLANMAELTAGNFKVHKMDWREWAKDWTDPIRFLHLDATHTTEEVADNLQALLPLAAPKAIFCGDDWNWPAVKEGVLKIFPPTKVHVFLNKLWWVNF